MRTERWDEPAGVPRAAGRLTADVRTTETPRGADVVRGVLLVALAVGLAASISVAQIALGLLAGWLVVARWAGWIGPLRWPLLLPMAAFAAWTVVAALASDDPTESLVESKGVLNLAALFVLVNALPRAAAARRFATWLVLAVAGAALFALVQVGVCPGADFTAAASFADKLLRKCSRARGFFSIYMTLAGVLAMTLTATLPRLARLGRDARWLGPAWIATATALALTYVRGAWLGLAAGALVAVAGLGRRGLHAAAALIVLGVGLMVALPNVRDRAATIGDPSNDTTRDRMAMIEVGLRLTATHPLTGIGPGQLKHVYPTEAPTTAMRRATSHLHNTPLQIAVQSGVVGLAFWLGIFVVFFGRGTAVLRRLPADAGPNRALVLGSLAAVVTFLVAGLFEFNFGDTEVLLVALVFMALPFAVGADVRPAEPSWPA
jgi:O-antigen ligase